MNDKIEFYQKLHDQKTGYAGGTYDPRVLLRMRIFSDFLTRYAGRPIRVLDVGCGKGFFLKNFCEEAQRRGAVIGAAVGLDLIRSDENVFDRAPDHYRFIQGSVEGDQMPFEAEAFDVIACNHVLEHIFYTEFLLREIARCLAPSGLAVISVPNIAAWINRALFLFASQPLGTEVGTESGTYGFWPSIGKKRLARFKPAGHIRDFTPRGLADVCAASGLAVVAWWNQSQTPFFPWTRWAGRNMGVIVRRQM